MIGYNTLYHISTDNDKTSERKIRPGNSGLLGLSIKNMKVKLKVANIKKENGIMDLSQDNTKLIQNSESAWNWMRPPA